MRGIFRKTLLAVAVITVAIGLSPPTASAADSPEYTESQLPGFSGGSVLFASGINDLGQVVGNGLTNNNEFVSLFWASGTSTPNVMNGGGIEAIASAINDSGQIVGVGNDSASGTAVIWSSPTSAPVPLSKGVWTSNTGATGINDSGQIVGSGQNASGPAPLYWSSASATPVALPTGDLISVAAEGINSAGQIVGTGVDQNSNQHVITWATPTATPVDLPSGVGNSVAAFGISDTGQIVGRSRALGFLSGILWPSATSEPFNLPNSSAGLDVNSAGVVVSTGPSLLTPVQRYYLRAQGTALTLNTNSPTNTTASFRDSAALKFAGGNPWKPIGTWNAPSSTTTRTLSGLSDLHAWFGLKNSDDQGTRFDFRGEVLKNGVVVGAVNEQQCVSGIQRNPTKALEVVLFRNTINPVQIAPADTLSVRVSARIGTGSDGKLCGGHANATGVRMYFDSTNRPAQIGLSFG